MRTLAHLALLLFCSFLLLGLSVGLVAVAQGRARLGTGMPIEYACFAILAAFIVYGCYAGAPIPRPPAA